MEVVVLIIILFLIFRPRKKDKAMQVKHKTSAARSKTPQKYKDMIRSERDMDRLTPEGELPFGWVTVYEDFIEDAKAELKYFYDEYYEHRYGEPKKKYAATKSLLLYFEDAKKLYAKKGECFLFWFENWWAKEEEIQRLKDEVKYIEEHYDELEAEYKKNQFFKSDILPQLPKIIRQNPGILQTDIYKQFPAEQKNNISFELYNMARNGIVVREKAGRTYSLKLKK